MKLLFDEQLSPSLERARVNGFAIRGGRRRRVHG